MKTILSAFILTLTIATSAQARTEITQDTACHVDMANGDAANDGLTWETAKANGQQCMDLISYKWDLAGGNASILYKDGQVDTYGIVYRGIVGVGEVHIESETCENKSEINVVGNEAEAMQGDMHKMAAYATWGSTNGVVRLKNIKLSNSGWGFGILGNGPSWTDIGDGSPGGDSCVEFGTADHGHIDPAATGAIILNRGDHKISGSAPYHVSAGWGGFFMNDNMPHKITIVGNPQFSSFVLSWGGTLFLNNLTYSGAATGGKWMAVQNGIIYTGGKCANLPGSTLGAAYYGGQCQ